MSIFNKDFFKTRHRNSGLFILITILLQFTYVNFINKKESLQLSQFPPALSAIDFNNELIQKRNIKAPDIAPFSMSANLNCQIQSNQIKCKSKNSTEENILNPSKLPVSISSAQDHSCLINKDGEVQCWSHKLKTNDFSFTKIPLKNPTIQISSSNDESCSLLKTGEVFCWKEKNSGFSDPTKKHLSDEAITSISSYGNHHCVTNQTGNVICWGEKYTTKQSETSHIQLREKALRISTGANQDCIITKRKRELICWSSDYAQISKAPILENIHEITQSEALSCGLTYEGKVYCWQKENLASLKLQLNTESEQSKLISMSSNSNEVCGLTDDQRIICWNQLKK
jgi:hypothetical protein